MHDIFFSLFNSKLISLLGYTWIIHTFSVIGSRWNSNCRSRCRPAEYRCIMWYRSNLDCIMELRPPSILHEYFHDGDALKDTFHNWVILTDGEHKWDGIKDCGRGYKNQMINSCFSLRPSRILNILTWIHHGFKRAHGLLARVTLNCQECVQVIFHF